MSCHTPLIVTVERAPMQFTAIELLKTGQTIQEPMDNLFRNTYPVARRASIFHRSAER